jgi:hypothetical protein
MKWQESISVQARLYWPVAADARQGDTQAAEALIEMEGDLNVVLSSPGNDSPFNEFLEPRTGFHLRFLQERSGSGGPVETEIVAHERRVTRNTTVNELRAYASYAEWRNDSDRMQAGMAMFISLALTGGRIIEDDLSQWPGFEVEQVVQTGRIGQDGSEFNVFEAQRVNESGDEEDWNVWVGSDGLPKRIELTVQSEDQDRSVRGAEMEITYSGKTFERPEFS